MTIKTDDNFYATKSRIKITIWYEHKQSSIHIVYLSSIVAYNLYLTDVSYYRLKILKIPPERSAMSSAGPSAGINLYEYRCCTVEKIWFYKYQPLFNTPCPRKIYGIRFQCLNLHVLRAECPWPIEDYINICFLYYISERYN